MGEKQGASFADVPSASGAPEALPVDSLREALPHLRRPFTPEAVRFKVQSTLGDAAGALIVAYIDARLVIERLNLVCPDLWSAAYEPVDGTKLMWCHLTIRDKSPIWASPDMEKLAYPHLVRRDVGESPKGMSKDLVSDSLKRAAVHFGVGVSIYALPQITLWVKDSKHLEVRQPRNGKKTIMLTPYGHGKLREGYAKWLDEHGRRLFGEPLDHGDVEGAVMDDEPAEDPIYVPERPAALDDPEAVHLREEIRSAWGNLKARDPKAVPPAVFNEWLSAASYSHEEMRRLLGTLEERNLRLMEATP